MSGVPVRQGARRATEQPPQLLDRMPARGPSGRRFSPRLPFLLWARSQDEMSTDPNDHRPKAEPPRVVQELRESWSRWEVGWKPWSEPHVQSERRAAKPSCLSWNLTEDSGSSQVGPVGSRWTWWIPKSE